MVAKLPTFRCSNSRASPEFRTDYDGWLNDRPPTVTNSDRMTDSVIQVVRPEVPESEDDWRRFYDANWTWVYRVVRRMGGGQINVEDVVQDVFLVLVDRLREFEGRAKLQTWVYRVCLNVVSEHRRRARRHLRLSH